MNDTSAIIILVAAILTNNILLTNFLGMCSFIACSGQIKTALGLGTAVTFVMTMTTIINYCIYKLFSNTLPWSQKIHNI